MFEYEATSDDEGLPGDVRVTLNYAKALDVGLAAVRQAGNSAITKSLIQDMHRVLMDGVKDYRDVPGELRTVQNWIGSGNIYDASLVPPPPNQVYLVTQSKNAISALTLKRQLGVSYPTAWLIKHKLLAVM